MIPSLAEAGFRNGSNLWTKSDRNVPTITMTKGGRVKDVGDLTGLGVISL